VAYSRSLPVLAIRDSRLKTLAFFGVREMARK
jgi:hypothetical protein